MKNPLTHRGQLVWLSKVGENIALGMYTNRSSQSTRKTPLRTIERVNKPELCVCRDKLNYVPSVM